eukprot:tig00021501_g21951.t1
MASKKVKAPPPLNLTIRLTVPSDIDPLSKIAYNVGRQMHSQHGLPPVLPTVEDTKALYQLILEDSTMYGVVAGVDNRIAGSAFLMEKDEIKSIVGLCVDPKFWNRGIGKKVIQVLIEKAETMGCRSVRMSFAEVINLSFFRILSTCGFKPQETVSWLVGVPKNAFDGRMEVRPMTMGDVDACDELFIETHGFSRRNDIMKCLDAIYAARPYVALFRGELVGYTTSFSYHGHTICRDVEVMKALFTVVSGIMNAAGITPRIAVFPRMYPSLLQWCLRDSEMRLERNTYYMVYGQYRPPQNNVYVPSSDY